MDLHPFQGGGGGGRNTAKETEMSSNGMGYAISIPGPFLHLGSEEL